MKAISYKTSLKQVQHGKMMHEEKTFKTLVVLGLVLLDLLFAYSAASFLTEPVTLKFLSRENKNRELAPMSNNRSLQLSQSDDNSTKLALWREQVKICSRHAVTAGDLSNDHRASAVQKQKKDYAEFVYCVATKLNRNLLDIAQEFVSANSKIVHLRIESGRQKRTNAIRAFFEAARDADHAIASGMLPIITIRMNPKKQGYVNRLALLMELDPCGEAMIKACATVCNLAQGAC